MTAPERFERIEPRLRALLTDLAAPSVPDYTNDLLARTSAMRQRPRWTFIERWFPMGVIARQRTFIPQVPWRALALAAILTALAIAAAVFVGTQRRPPPFGLAANGSLVHDRAGDIYIRDTVSANQRLLVGGSDYDFAPGFTRDGTSVAFLRMVEDRPGFHPDVIAVMVANTDGSGIRQLTGGLEAPDWFDWSPDDRQLVVQSMADGFPTLQVIDVQTGARRPLRVDMPSYTPSWRGPDGREIVFRGWIDGEPRASAAIMAIRPDGTGLRVVSPLEDDLHAAYQHPQVSPDGRYVTYTAFDDERNYRVHLLEIDTGHIETLELGPAGGHQGFGSFSPDGSLLVFHWISRNNQVQVMVAPIDGSGPAVKLGPTYPIVNGNASLQQAFSPDGTVVVIQGRDGETRLVNVATGGPGKVLPWEAESVPGWQRLPPD